MTDPVPTTGSRRIDVYDGLRGIAIVLVVLSHGWVLWPTTSISSNDALRPWFTDGNYAVSFFFVVGAFLMTRGLLRRNEVSGTLHPGVEFLRRFLRISAQVYLLLVVVALVAILDTTETYADTETRTSLLRIGSYTWNWYLQDHALAARPDLGHLWYLSVDMQVFVLVLFTVYLLRRRPAWLLTALALLLVASLSWRSHVYDTEGLYQALLRTTVRMDAPLAGATAAAALPYLKRLAPSAGRIATLCMVALLPLLYANSDTHDFFTWPGLVLDLVLALFMVACTLGSPGRLVTVALGWAPLAFLGRHSLSLYLWHYTTFWFVSRHSVDWAWPARTAVALGVTLLGAFLSEAIAENRVQRLLRSPAWKQLEHGIPSYLAGLAKAGWHKQRNARNKRKESTSS
jgi:peptidoglycan/LPS O-acetylase OafA/YrhL